MLVVWVVTSEVKWELMADIDIRVINRLVPGLMIALVCSSMMWDLVIGLHSMVKIAIWVRGLVDVMFHILMGMGIRVGIKSVVQYLMLGSLVGMVD